MTEAPINQTATMIGAKIRNSIMEKVPPSHAAHDCRRNPNHDHKRDSDCKNNKFNHHKSPFL